VGSNNHCYEVVGLYIISFLACFEGESLSSHASHLSPSESLSHPHPLPHEAETPSLFPLLWYKILGGNLFPVFRLDQVLSVLPCVDHYGYAYMNPNLIPLTSLPSPITCLFLLLLPLHTHLLIRG
jgi:hypothetical protein